MTWIRKKTKRNKRRSKIKEASLKVPGPLPSPPRPLGFPQERYLPMHKSSDMLCSTPPLSVPPQQNAEVEGESCTQKAGEPLRSLLLPTPHLNADDL